MVKSSCSEGRHQPEDGEEQLQHHQHHSPLELGQRHDALLPRHRAHRHVCTLDFGRTQAGEQEEKPVLAVTEARVYRAHHAPATVQQCIARLPVNVTASGARSRSDVEDLPAARSGAFLVLISGGVVGHAGQLLFCA